MNNKFLGGIKMYDLLKEFVKPELLILIPVMYVIGMVLKKSTVSDKKIPSILGILGIILSLIYLLATSVISGWQNALMLIFTGITQGVLVAGASVYFNQLVKQAEKGE